MAQADDAKLAGNFGIGAYNSEMSAENPMRKGAEAAMDDYAEKARTAKGRNDLVESYLSGGVGAAVQERDASYRQGGDLKDQVQATAYKQAEVQILGNLEHPERRQDLADFARAKAAESGKPFEEVGSKEGWGLNEKLIDPGQAKGDISQPRGNRLELEIGGAPNMSGEAVSKMMNRIDQSVEAEGKDQAPAARRREDAMER